MASHAFLEGLALSRVESRVELAILAFGNLFHEVLCAMALGVTVASATLMAGGRAIGLCRGLSLVYLVALMPLCGFLCGALLAALANTFSLALFSTWFAAHAHVSAATAATAGALNATHTLLTTPASTLALVSTTTAAARLNLTTAVAASAASLHAAAASAVSALPAGVGAGAAVGSGSGHVQAIVAAGVDPTAAVGAVLTALVLSFAAGTYLHISFLDLLARQTATSAGLFGTSGQQVGNRLLKVALCFTGFFFIALLRFIFPHVHS